jgi:hypothetical protein
MHSVNNNKEVQAIPLAFCLLTCGSGKLGVLKQGTFTPVYSEPLEPESYKLN